MIKVKFPWNMNELIMLNNSSNLIEIKIYRRRKIFSQKTLNCDKVRKLFF